MKQTIRFTDCIDVAGEPQGPAVIDAATITGVEARRLVFGGRDGSPYLNGHVRVVPCTQVSYGAGEYLYVREPLEEVLWRLGILA